MDGTAQIYGCWPRCIIDEIRNIIIDIVTNGRKHYIVGKCCCRSRVVSSAESDEVSFNRQLPIARTFKEMKPRLIDVLAQEIVPLTDELRKKLDLKNRMHTMLAFIVVEVEFTDGTKYSDEKTYKSMTEYVEKLVNALDVLEEKERQTAKKQL